jgi:hypothetical protein
MGAIRGLGLEESFLDTHSSAITRACFRRLGGFAPQLRYMAEHDLGARLHRAGVRIDVLRIPPVAHYPLTRLAEYARTIRIQGEDRTRILALRGEAFASRYFPAPRFLRLRPALERLKRPLVAAYGVLVGADRFAFHVAHRLGLAGVATSFFRRMAHHSLHAGQIAALGEAP